MSATLSTPGGTTGATTKPLVELREYGQSAGLDYIRCSLIAEGDGLGGVITGSADYADTLVEVRQGKDRDAMGVYEVIAIPVRGQKFTFGVLKAAQARGDFQVLADRNRRALRVHLHDVDSGLAALETAIAKALS